MRDNVVISVEGLTRTYKIRKNKESILQRLISNEYTTITAVKDVSFKINKGEIVGFIGPNGAGKSTTIKMLAGILIPSQGSIEVLGRIPHKSRKINARKIGVVFGQRTQLWWDLPLTDTFKLLKHMYQIPDDIYEYNLQVFIEALNIDQFMNQPVRQLSLGQRMRGEIAAALLHDPEILFLDEPTIGLDIVAKQQLRNFIKEINAKKNITIILTTHDMKDIENLCHKIILINRGEIIIDMPIEKVKSQFSNTHDIKLTFETQPGSLALQEGCTLIKHNNTEYVFRIQDEKISINDFVSYCMKKYKIQDITIEGTDIEEIIRRLYQDL